MTAFYPTIDATCVRDYLPAVPIMLSAASIETRSRSLGKPGKLPVPKLPAHVTEVAMDPGGFSAQVRNHGSYRFSWGAYEDLLYGLGDKLTWAAFPDLPCEKELASDSYAVRARQEQTLEYAHDLWGTVFDTDGSIDVTEGFDYRIDFPWTWVATIQGRNVDEYVWMAEQLLPLLDAQQRDYEGIADPNHGTLGAMLDEGPPDYVIAAGRRAIRATEHFRVAIGSLCRRDKVQEVIDIVNAVREVLPDERFHLWGIKLDAVAGLARAGLLPYMASMDSSAWNRRFGNRIAEFNAQMKLRGMFQREYAIKVLLPEYMKKIERALATPAQSSLFTANEHECNCQLCI